MTTTIQFSTGQTFDLPPDTDPSAEHQLVLTIRNNPQARHLSPILQGSIDVWKEMRVPVDPVYRLLEVIVATCDDHPDAMVSVEGFELPAYGTPGGRELLDGEMTMTGTMPEYDPRTDRVEMNIPSAADVRADAAFQRGWEAGRQVPGDPSIVGPGDLLVISLSVRTSDLEFEETVERIKATGYAERVLVIRGAEHMAAVQGKPDIQITNMDGVA